MAERVGFEPTERFPVHSISSAANSTTLAPLRGKNFAFRIADCGLRNSKTTAKKPKRLSSKQSAIRNPQSEISSSAHAAPRANLIVLMQQLIGRPFDHPAGRSSYPTSLDTRERLFVANTAH